MKTKILLLSLSFLFFTNLFAQQDSLIVAIPPIGPPPSTSGTIYFTFDNSGNQIKRSYNYGEYSKQEVITTKVSTEENIEENKSELTYFPNPIENELTITWAKSKSTTISSILVFSVNGKLVKTFNPSKNSRELILPFYDVAIGVYIIQVAFNNGKQNSFKIIKQ